MRPTIRFAAFMATIILATTARAQMPTYVQSVPLDPANIDRSASACVDFNKYANGGWARRDSVPAAFSRWGSFDELGERNQAALLGILTSASTNTSARRSRNERMLGDYFSSCMDSAAAERAGAKPIAANLARITAIRTRAQLQPEIARLHRQGVNVIFTFGAAQDAKNSESVIGAAYQGGLGLPDRDYYFKADAGSRTIRENYAGHIQKLFELTGSSATRAAASARGVMAIETALAAASMTRVELRDPVATYNYRSRAQLAQMTPGFNWTNYFRTLGKADIPAVDVQNPRFMMVVDSLLRTASVEDWKSYLHARVMKAYAGRLSSDFVNEDFRFSRTLSGARELLPRVKRCTRATDSGLRDVLGQAYVEKNFTPEARARALEMIGNLVAVYRERINALPWMTEVTRKQALIKLNTYAQKIGYPDKWRDYSALNVSRRSYVANVIAAAENEHRRELLTIGRPVDRMQWEMSPPTVNAYYNPAMNEMVFPAGILQPPFFDAKADDAVNYGGMGAVIGHEISHGFDDQGGQYDERGNLRNWWTAEDLESFRKRTALVSKQFDDYVVLDSVHVNGKLTLGENIADLGGLSVAYAALQKSLAAKGRPPLIDGMTPEQRFFLGWAQIWRQNIRDAALRQRIITDPHSPGVWRVNGPLSNLPEFAAAFGCKPGDQMVRAENARAVIW